MSRRIPFVTAQSLSSYMNIEWNPEFLKRRKLNHKSENKPFLETIAEIEIGTESLAGTPARPIELDHAIPQFIREHDQSEICTPEADMILAFCNNSNFESLLNGRGNNAKCALLDERNFKGGGVQVRTQKGPLTALELYKALKKPRFHSSADTQDSATLNAESAEEERPEPDADRRLIFLTDLDGWSMLALIGTASDSQAPALRNALYRHVAAQTFVGVTCASPGYFVFQLAFHLPYYAWRDTNIPIEDHRRDSRGEPMRELHDVSFLNCKSDALHSFIYEAQISCVVAGSDVWRWVAYCFVDSYFDGNDDAQETVMAYYEDSQIDGGVLMDPCTVGSSPLCANIEDPWEWFLLVFRCRLDQIRSEWRQVVWKVRQSIRDYEKVWVHRYAPDPSGNRWFGEVREQKEEIREPEKWVAKAKNLLTLLLPRLTWTVDECERFMSTYNIYFDGVSDAKHIELSRCGIQTSFEDLKFQVKTLKDTADVCDDFIKKVSYSPFVFPQIFLACH
ncbi:uncharacterized protein Z518_01311 [Rhinocladiella mackenziei CBS 650.93]|uniref:Uncharacterized protein n=1 Tax=Rhinocladiella mackenziei CBS 650.93 TaxID=1442369 RepID=A0A0D2JL90_9EURO|nr:uncharacterized protein Z518_01311 [Rhinocladiella mackenziei CBS 650.93]KIX10230.1 hypothetical protein Z518_01311 [Rhinocladiella mackenziei CBS 650.93]